jgi:hypothetical protein
MVSADGTMDGTYLNEYFDQIVPAFKKAGYDIRHGRHLEEWIRTAGFTNIKVQKHIVPMGTWPKDKRLVRYHRSLLQPSSHNWTDWCFSSRI